MFDCIKIGLWLESNNIQIQQEPKTVIYSGGCRSIKAISSKTQIDILRSRVCVWTEIGKVWEGGAYSFPIITLQLYILSVPCRRAVENILLNNKWSHIHHRNKRLSNKGEHKSHRNQIIAHIQYHQMNFNPKLSLSFCLSLYFCLSLCFCLPLYLSFYPANC